MFVSEMKRPPYPNWRKAGVDGDVPSRHIYKALFSLAADSEFLVADRLQVWSLDLASSALAMHALAWTDRYVTFGGVEVSDELMFWAAFDELLFQTSEPNFDRFGLGPAMSRCNAQWDRDSRDTLMQARKTYFCELSELGTNPSELAAIAERCADAHPLIYRA